MRMQGVRTTVIISAIFVLGTPPTTSSAAPTKEQGTLVATGAVHGRWALTSCEVGMSQGAERLTITFGPSKGPPEIAVTVEGPVPSSGRINLATVYNDDAEFESPSGSYWESGWVSGPTKDAGSGMISMSRNVTSGSMTATMVKSGVADVHLNVSWKYCPRVALSNN